MKYQYMPHTGDIKLKIYGSSLPNIFENTALALSNFMSKDKKVSKKIEKTIKIKETNPESLLYSFIDELIYLFDAESFLVAEAKVKIKDNKLEAKLKGDSAKNYKDLDAIKAATYAEMYIKKASSGWEAQFVVDV